MREILVLYALLSMRFRGYLSTTGWITSYVNRAPLDREGRPLPWLTYPFIDFIGPRLSPSFRVFEFGSGNSTLYLAERVAFLTSIEHDSVWLERIRGSCPNNVRLLYAGLENGNEYPQTILSESKLYDLVFIDGRRRNQCMAYALECLAPQGVIVLDDSERDDYVPAIDQAANAGYRRLDFWGMASGIYEKKCTTVFYRDPNCLGI